MINIDVVFNMLSGSANINSKIRAFDSNAYTIRASLTDDIDLIGKTVSANIKRSDNTVILDSATVVDSTHFEYKICDNGLLMPGYIEIDFSIFDTDYKATTPKLVFNVQKPVPQENAIEASEVAPILLTLVTADYEGLYYSANQAETLRIANESARVTAETERQDDETTRLLNESNRMTAEQSRVSAETVRTNQESSRSSAESTRVQQETTRQSNEVSRQSTFNTITQSWETLTTEQTSNAEVIVARTDSEGTEHGSLKDHLDAWESKVAEISDKLSKEQSKPLTVMDIITVDDAYGGPVDFTVYGDTIRQLVKNPTIIDTTFWIPWSGTSLSATLNKLTCLGQGTNPLLRVSQDFGFKGKNGDKYYRKARIRVTDALCLSLGATLRDGVSNTLLGTVTVSTPDQNKWYDLELDEIVSLNSDTAENLHIQFTATYADNATQSGKVMEIDGGSGVKTIKITGNDLTLTADQLSSKYSKPLAYGLNHVKNPSVCQHGENCFDKSKATFGYYVDTVTGNLVASITKSVSDFIRIKPSTVYKTNALDTWAIYDINKKFIYADYSNNISAIVNAAYIRVTVLNVDTFQLNEGSTDLPYTPYNPSEITTENVVLRSSNAKKDELTQINGKNILYKNTSDEITFDGSVDENWVLATGANNQIDTIAFLITKPEYKATSSSIANVKSNWYDYGASVYHTDIESISVDSGGYIVFRVLRSTGVTDVPSFKTWLSNNHKKGVFTLATPLTITEDDFPTYGISIAGDGIITTSANQLNTFIVSSDTLNPTVELSYDLNIFTAFNSIKDVLKETRSLVTYLLTIQDEQDALLLDYGNRLSLLEGA